MSTLLERPEPPTLPLPVASRSGVTVPLLAVAIALLVVLSWPLPFYWARGVMSAEADSALAAAVPFLALLMFWHRRAALRAVPQTPCAAALLLLLPSVALLLWSSVQTMHWLMSTGFLLSLWGALWLVLGTHWMRAACVPLAFLLWMSPLPGPLVDDATAGAQHLCTVAAGGVLHLLAFHPVVVGSVIKLENFSLAVDAPCSGLKNLLSMLTIGMALAALLDGPPARRLALFLAAAPLSIVVNVARLVVLAIVGECFGGHVARAFHDWDGLLSLAGGVTVLFWIAWRMGCRTLAGRPLFSS